MVVWSNRSEVVASFPAENSPDEYCSSRVFCDWSRSSCCSMVLMELRSSSHFSFSCATSALAFSFVSSSAVMAISCECYNNELYTIRVYLCQLPSFKHWLFNFLTKRYYLSLFLLGSVLLTFMLLHNYPFLWEIKSPLKGSYCTSRSWSVNIVL